MLYINVLKLDGCISPLLTAIDNQLDLQVTWTPVVSSAIQNFLATNLLQLTTYYPELWIDCKQAYVRTTSPFFMKLGGRV